MSFIQRELDKIQKVLLEQQDKDRALYDQLYIAQQALGWALDPTNVRSPYNQIMQIADDNTNGLKYATMIPPISTHEEFLAKSSELKDE